MSPTERLPFFILWGLGLTLVLSLAAHGQYHAQLHRQRPELAAKRAMVYTGTALGGHIAEQRRLPALFIDLQRDSIDRLIEVPDDHFAQEDTRAGQCRSFSRTALPTPPPIPKAPPQSPISTA